MMRNIRRQIIKQHDAPKTVLRHSFMIILVLLSFKVESFCVRNYERFPFFSSRLLSSLQSTTESKQEVDLNLTPELEKLTSFFGHFPDEKSRYKQLLFLANSLPPVDPSVLIPENKVPGCLSTVHVDCKCETDDKSGKKVIRFFGESDGLLTKGLLALLVRGLSGYTADEIEAVNPKFITASKIDQSLTPSRNNGFLNMMKVMKHKARLAVSTVEEASSSDDDELSFNEVEGKPMYNSIMSKLTATLKPKKIDLIDNSHQHAGHSGSKGWEESGESHFSLYIVSDAFEGLPLIKRHQLIYMLLVDVMDKIHALQIQAKSPSEIQN